MHRLERQLLAYASRNKEARDATIALGLFAWAPSTRSIFAATGGVYKHSVSLRMRALVNGLANNWWPLDALESFLGKHTAQRMLTKVGAVSTTVDAEDVLGHKERLCYWDPLDKLDNDSLFICPMMGAKTGWLLFVVWSILLDDLWRSGELCKLGWESADALAVRLLNNLIDPWAIKPRPEKTRVGEFYSIVKALTDPRLFLRGTDRLIPADVSRYVKNSKRSLVSSYAPPFVYGKLMPTVGEKEWRDATLEFGPRVASDIWAIKWASSNLWTTSSRADNIARAMSRQESKLYGGVD